MCWLIVISCCVVFSCVCSEVFCMVVVIMLVFSVICVVSSW